MLIASLLLAITTTVTHGDTVTRGAIEREVGDLVRIRTFPGPNGHDSVRVVVFSVDSARPGSLLAPFLRAHGRIVWYLASHTRGAEAQPLGDGQDPIAARDSVASTLRTSPVFNDRLLQMLSEYWSHTGRVIDGYAPIAEVPSLSVTALSRIGARFFYPDRISATGDTLFTHICSGINGLGDLAEPVDPLTEAFVFVAVTSSFQQPHSPLMQAFDVAVKRAKGTSASKDPAKRVLRAQGALWSQLEQSPELARAFTTAYAEQEAALPFRLSPAVP
ncbi:MAG: hypothetical protein ACYC3L_06785 [Gemmatimonadaceae bacterium]